MTRTNSNPIRTVLIPLGASRSAYRSIDLPAPRPLRGCYAAVASESPGGVRLWRLACLALWLSFAPLAQAQPANDDFIDAETLTGRSGSATGSNFGATKEPGEPLHASNLGGASIWFSWPAPTNGTFAFDTIGSGFDTLLGVYTGGSVATLSLVASDDDIGGGVLQSALQFVASAGTTYRIAVDGYDGEEGSVMLSWRPMAPSLSIRSSGPLTNITVGPDGSFQVYHSNFLTGQVYPPFSAPADAGFFVRQNGGTVNGLDLVNRSTFAHPTLSRGFNPISQSLSQNGLEVTMVMDNQGDGTANRFQVTQVTRYRPGAEFFVVENTVLNQGASPFTADFFAAGDLYLADSDYGFGFQNSSCGVIGGTEINGVYHIFVQGKPGNPLPVLFQEDFYRTIWEVIGTAGQPFVNTFRLDYIDNGAGLQWPNVTLAPGASVRFAYYWAFGALSSVAEPPILSIQAVGSDVQICWPASCQTYLLEQTESLRPTIQWAPVGAPVMILNDQNQVTLPRGSTNHFFRLAQ